jgi:hypothetical protein
MSQKYFFSSCLSKYTGIFEGIQTAKYGSKDLSDSSVSSIPVRGCITFINAF